MSPLVHVRSVDALLDLKQSLARYAHEVAAPLAALEQETARTLEWLGERRRHWLRAVQEAQQTVQAAQAALARCEATVYRDPKTGAVYRSDCSAYKAALGQAIRHLRTVEAELRKVEQALHAVGQAQADFRRRHQRLRAFLDHDLAEAQTFLERRAASLRAYAAGGLPTGYTVTAPTDALAGLFTLGLVAGAIGLTSVAIAAINRLAGPWRSALGDSGEALAQTLLQKELGWRALPFDQPKHGFDRVFSAPGLPLVIVECKVNRKGELHLGQPQSGVQGSPDWIAAQAAQMADPASAQYSLDNAALAALIEELGPENVPVVAVVITTETGAVDLYARHPGSSAWERVEEGVDLTALLQTPPAPTGPPPAELP